MEVKKGKIAMIKLLFAIPLIALALFTNTLVPAVTTVTFQPDTTLAQVVALLEDNDTWANGNNFTIQEGLQFYYRQGGMSIEERQKAVWQTRQGLAEINNQPTEAAILDCLAKDCPVTIQKITLLNPSTNLLSAPIIASNEARRQLHPFFQENQLLGHP
jgi:hypothetical protein